MKTTIRKEAARLWYALKIAAGTGPDEGVEGQAPRASKLMIGELRGSTEADVLVDGVARDVSRERSPALVLISRAGRSNVSAQHRRNLNADGSRPAYALPYNADPVERKAVGSGGVTGMPVDGDAGVVV